MKLPSQSISTRDIPQADVLDNVITVVEAVSQGKSSFQDIARELGLTERQGRYYRRAAEILGFIVRIPRQNVSTLTPLGHKLLRGNIGQKEQILTTQIFGVPIIQNVLGVLASSRGRATKRNLVRALWQAVPGTTQSMAERRLVTILSWLERLDIIRKSGRWVRIHHLPSSVSTIEISDPNVPVLPKPSDLRLYKKVHRRRREASRIIRFEVDMVKLERANAIHERLRSLLAERIKRFGVLPTYNRYIDLAARINSQDFIIEVKSSGKVHEQVRRGISQLYEYRYLQCLPKAKLFLLLEKPLTGRVEWLLDYLINDRGIYVIWDASNDRLFTTEEGERNLPFMQ